MQVEIGEDRLSQGVTLQPCHQAGQGRVDHRDLEINKHFKI
jgi:hypothetical protein